MKVLIAKKIEMSQRFKEDGTVAPVTLLQAGPCKVTQIKTDEKDGYQSVQLGCGSSKNLTKPMKGHLKASGAGTATLREFRLESTEGLEVGAEINVSQFTPGEFVNVTGLSKGKGFQGVVKRHGFHGSPASHGHKDQLRMPGSIGSTGPQRVFKGTRMAGRTGHDRVTVKNLEVIEVDAEKNVLAVKGAVPGARGSVILISGGYDKKQSWK
jgi:large subunit ribosomal protein L3